MLYIDEFQDLINLPIAPADMFAQARSRGLAMTVAHQDLSQLTKNRDVQDAAMNNARSKVVFQVEQDDACLRNVARWCRWSCFKRLYRRLLTSETVDFSTPLTGVETID